MISKKLLTWAQNKPIDVVIGGDANPYLLRWFLIPRNPVFNIYVHCFLRSDDDRALHDHPWLFNCSILLKGQYLEHTQAGKFLRKAGEWKFRLGPAAHRVELFRPAIAVGNGPARGFDKEISCWTVFITGPRIRQWGFHCPQGWIHWKKFTDDAGTGIGKGCDQ